MDRLGFSKGPHSLLLHAHATQSPAANEGNEDHTGSSLRIPLGSPVEQKDRELPLRLDLGAGACAKWPQCSRSAIAQLKMAMPCNAMGPSMAISFRPLASSTFVGLAARLPACEIPVVDTGASRHVPSYRRVKQLRGKNVASSV